MEKNSLERIVNAMKLFDGINYSAATEKILYGTYSKFGEKAVLDLASRLLDDKAESVLTLGNVKTVSGNAKIITYVNLYNELKEMRAFYER
ncbi:MAG: hypothetical protein M1322_02880 [Candidatus Parvarchaeota archaeon]|jgi:hypothetical protein|nr:hypothetical protein [Candidatus Parvarchaeota archaeon]MCL5107028.1 hypothetical protein [Candidatus Parvarchaeota archaeon]